MELGIYTFAERTPDPATGALISPQQRMAELLEEIERADELGLAAFGVGEHHRPEYLASAPAVILAAAAARTRRIRLASAVTVLSSDDPVRVFQDFATLDLISGGRAEIMAGRGSFIESFPLFGYALDDYPSLFAEKLELLLRLRKAERVTWSGRHRPPLGGEGVYPRPLQDPLPVWIAMGGTPASAARAGELGLPLALAILGGDPLQFVPLIELYRRRAKQAGQDSDQLKVGLNLHGFVADTPEDAAEIAYPSFTAVMNQIGRERGWAPMDRGQFEAMRAPEGALLVGGPEEVAAKIVRLARAFHNDRLLIQLSVGTLPHAQVMRAIELLGSEVAPRVARALSH